MDRSEDTRDIAADPQTVGTGAAKTAGPAVGRAPPLPSPVSDLKFAVPELDLPRPYAVASSRHTLPPTAKIPAFDAPVLSSASPTSTHPKVDLDESPLPVLHGERARVRGDTFSEQAAASHTNPRPLPSATAWGEGDVLAISNNTSVDIDNDSGGLTASRPPQPLLPFAYRLIEPAPASPSAPVPSAEITASVPPPAPATSIIDTTLRVAPARRPTEATELPAATATLAPAVADSPTKTFARKALRVAGYAFAGYMALVFALIVVYRFVNPPMSSLMLQQRLTGQDILQDWVSLDAISPQIVRAVLVSEDGRFCQHHGIDLLEMQAAIERAQDGIPRGASTISMQLTKNLFLWPSKSYLRKAIEIPLTLAIELLWPKWRIMEVYLNIAELGPGIFGVESASRFYFDKAARRLNEREAAQLAVALPNPISRDPGEPGRRTQRLASDVQDRMRATPPSQTACVLASRRSG